VFAQNHDQVGNRAQGDRLSTLIPFAAQQVLTASVLLSPFIPLLFMGEEYGERAPFQYFIDHGDERLIEAVRKGRLAEFKPFGWKNIPDPYASTTFEHSRLTPKEARNDAQQHMANWTKQLITLRKHHASLGTGLKGHQLILGFNDQPTTLTLSQPKGQWTLLLDNTQLEYAEPNNVPTPHAPSEIDLTSTKQPLSLPAFPTWVYKST
jgi:maltooligosyltrehalose trehalohydrolase